MTLNRPRTVALVILVVAIAASAVMGLGIFSVIRAMTRPPQPRESLRVTMDGTGPYLILATRRAATSYATAIAKARALHPDAVFATFDPESPDDLEPVLKQHQPRYALVFIEPHELDVNFAWKWLEISTQIDGDPFVDVRTGFITGATPEAAAEFVERIARAARGELELPGRLIDNLGPNPQAAKGAFYQTRGCFLIPVYDERVSLATVSHGTQAFTDRRLTSLDKAGLIHLGGHGYPDRIVDGVSGSQAGRLQLSPCVIFNGACYTGVTHRWFEPFGAEGKVVEREVAPGECFCLNLLGNRVVAYLAALHPDHGIPVYQEMEYLAFSGASLGDVIRHTHNGVVLGCGGKLPALESFAGGMPSPRWTPSDVMLKGTAARVLFGDPALVVTDAFTSPPFEISLTEPKDGRLQITAVLANGKLKSTYTDTYHADLASNKQLFNDRALIVAALPAGWDRVAKVEVVDVSADGKSLAHRLVGYAVERDGDARLLHVQVDLPSTGYMQSDFRQQGAKVVLAVFR